MVIWFIVGCIYLISKNVPWLQYQNKEKSVVSSECLQTPEANILNNINILKYELLAWKIPSLKDYKKKMKDFMSNANSWKTEWLL